MTEFDFHLSKAAKLCSKKELCEWDLKDKFLRWDTPVSFQAGIIDFLHTENYINHQRYANAFVHDKFTFNKWGKQKLRHILTTKRINNHFIEDAISSISEDAYSEVISKHIEAKAKTINLKDNEKAKAKIYRYLVTKGFETDSFISKLNDFFNEI